MVWQEIVTKHYGLEENLRKADHRWWQIVNFIKYARKRLELVRLRE